MGNLTLAKRQAQDALALSSNKEIEAMSAIALALAGDAAQATRLAAVLDKEFPEDTIVQFRSPSPPFTPPLHFAEAIPAELSKLWRRRRPTSWETLRRM